MDVPKVLKNGRAEVTIPNGGIVKIMGRSWPHC